MNTPTETEVGGDDSDDEGFPGTAEHPIDGEGSPGMEDNDEGEGSTGGDDENNEEGVENEMGAGEEMEDEETKTIPVFKDKLGQPKSAPEPVEADDDDFINSGASR